MIKCGIIGLGKMGISHYAIINAHPDVSLIAVCDTSGLILNGLNKYNEVQTFKDYRKMIDKCNLDCVIIATPTSSHAKIIQYAMEHNIHVFVEKPFCFNLEDGRDLTNLALQRNLVNQVGYHNRFIGVFQETRKLLDQGAIGDVYNFTAEAYGQVVLKQKNSTWRMKRSEGGGCLYDYASHVIDLVNYLIGPPEEVCGTVLKSIFSRDVADAVYSTFLYNNGKSGRLAVNWSDKTYRKMSTQITVYGTTGKIIADRQECRIYLWNADGFGKLKQGWNILYTTDLTKPVWFYLRGEEYSAQIDYFVKRVKSNESENINSFASALRTDITVDLLLNDAGKRNFSHG
ncbi:MAG: Gfo/Idh/MocA family oxidoreductase [Planctomycetes bacterium]|nr:Gfo/Idh/MocA family oxidoreductase [Planctomycetota bacterium]